MVYSGKNFATVRLRIVNLNWNIVTPIQYLVWSGTVGWLFQGKQPTNLSVLCKTNKLPGSLSDFLWRFGTDSDILFCNLGSCNRVVEYLIHVTAQLGSCKASMVTTCSFCTPVLFASSNSLHLSLPFFNVRHSSNDKRPDKRLWIKPLIVWEEEENCQTEGSCKTEG